MAISPEKEKQLKEAWQKTLEQIQKDKELAEKDRLWREELARRELEERRRWENGIA